MKKGLIVNEYGTKEYYLNNLWHRVDGPAIEYADGTNYWFMHGKKHREDGPAEEMKNGSKRWWLNGKRHRENGPAEMWANGSKFWWLNGKKHRVDGPAEEWANGDKFWYLHDKQLIYPYEFETMETWFEKLNTDENYSLQWINDINGLIEYINNPTPKQKRLNAMKWKL